jgi:hypothetical protein
MPEPIHKEAAPADDKSGKAAGKESVQKTDGTNPSNGQSIAQVAGAEKPGSSGTKDNKDDRDSLIVDLKKENREMKKMIRDEVIPTIKDLQQQIKKGGTCASRTLKTNWMQSPIEVEAQSLNFHPKSWLSTSSQQVQEAIRGRVPFRY